MPKTDARIVSAQLEAHDVDQLQTLARRSDRSLSAEIRRAVREHLDRAGELDDSSAATASAA